MQIYCFDIDGAPEWPSGTAISARDRRTASSVILYRDLNLGQGTGSDAVHVHRRRALSVLAASSNPTHHPRPLVELFTCNKFLGLAAPDAATAAPVLQKLRAEGFFRVAQAPAPPPPPPPLVLCSHCRQARPVNAAGVCVACASNKKKAKVTADPPRRVGLAIPILIALVALALYVWWPKPTFMPAAKVIAPIVQFSANHQSVKRGSRVLLSWNTSGFSTVSISPNIGIVPASGKRSVAVNQQTTFSLTGTGTSYTRPVTVTIYVTVPDVAPPSKPTPYSGNSPSLSDASQTSPPLSPPLVVEDPRQARPDLGYQSRLAVTAALENWAAACRANDASRQAALYAPQVERFFKQQNVTSGYVQIYMTNFYARGSRFTSFSLTAPTITLNDSDNASVNFVKHYTLQLANGEVRSVNSRSEIHMTRITGVWKIIFERDFLG